MSKRPTVLQEVQATQPRTAIFTHYYCQGCDETWHKGKGKRCPTCKKPAEPLTSVELQAEADAANKTPTKK